MGYPLGLIGIMEKNMEATRIGSQCFCGFVQDLGVSGFVKGLGVRL